MPFISQEELINGLPNATPEQVLLINHFYASFNNRNAVNRRIVNVELLNYQGASGGSEFVTYAATKLYLCFKLEASTTPANVPNVTPNGISIYNEVNAIFEYLYNVSNLYTGAAYSYAHNVCNKTNFYFSRIGTGQYSFIQFIGYRITLI
jgi:hypothetical protein